jgi:hypothetical protein
VSPSVIEATEQEKAPLSVEVRLGPERAWGGGLSVVRTPKSVGAKVIRSKPSMPVG